MTGGDSSARDAGRDAGEYAEEAARCASPWVERMARFGYVAKGVVYVVMGVLAVLAAVNAGGGSTTDQNGAFQTIEEAPFGQVLLGVVAVGLMGYVLWRSIQAVADPDGEGLEPKGVLKRIGYAGSALLHTFFAFTAANLAAGAGGDWGSSAEEWTGWFLSLPLGWLLIATTGIGIVGVGLYQIYEAYQSKFKKYLKLGALSDGEPGWIEHGGRFGVAARGVVFIIAGVFLVLAALRTDEQEVRSLGGALSAILEQPFSGISSWASWPSGWWPTAYSWSPSPATAASRRTMPFRMQSILGFKLAGLIENCSESFMRQVGFVDIFIRRLHPGSQR